MSKRLLSMRYKYFLAVTLLVFLVGCKSTPSELDEGLNLGLFEGVVGTSPNSGLYEELNGTASFSMKSANILEIELLTEAPSSTEQTKVYFRIETEFMPENGIYPFGNVDTKTAVSSTSFSGYYLSPTVGLGDQYYSESGTLEITSSSEDELKGEFNVKIFSKQPIGPSEYARKYSTLKGEFYARKN